jgi:hypothetical protein
MTGRSNRNSVHYMDTAPEKVVGLERKMTGWFSLYLYIYIYIYIYILIQLILFI